MDARRPCCTGTWQATCFATRDNGHRPMPSGLTAVFCLASLSRPEQALVILEPCRPDQPPLFPPLQNSPLLFGRRLTSKGIVRLRK